MVHRISVYDGRRLCGFLVDQDVPGGRQHRLGPAQAFDQDGRPLGVFSNRKQAVGAIIARDVFEMGRAAA